MSEPINVKYTGAVQLSSASQVTVRRSPEDEWQAIGGEWEKVAEANTKIAQELISLQSHYRSRALGAAILCATLAVVLSCVLVSLALVIP